VFNVFDEDNTGYIDFEEFLMALSVTSRGNVEDKLDCKYLSGKIYKSQGQAIIIYP